jgi:signal transduction histidine kinase
VTVSILDNGRGFDSNDQEAGRSRKGRKATLGLAGMAERANLLEGHIEIQTAQTIGTRVTLTVPLRKIQQNHFHIPTIDEVRPA